MVDKALEEIESIDRDIKAALTRLLDLRSKSFLLAERGYRVVITSKYKLVAKQEPLSSYVNFTLIKETGSKFFGRKIKLIEFSQFPGSPVREYYLNPSYVNEAYEAIQDIASGYVSQIKTIVSTIEKPNLSGKIREFSNEFDRLLGEIV